MLMLMLGWIRIGGLLPLINSLLRCAMRWQSFVFGVVSTCPAPANTASGTRIASVPSTNCLMRVAAVVGGQLEKYVSPN